MIIHGIGALVLVGLLAGEARAEDAPPAPGDAGRVGETIALVTEAYGGIERIDASFGWHMRGRVLSVADGVNGTLELAVALDGSLRLEIRYPNRTEIRVLAGVLAWHGGARRQRPASRPMTDSMRLQYHRLVAPFDLVAAEPGELVDEGDTPDGHIRLRREWNARISTVYEVDPESGLVMVVRGEIEDEDGFLEFVAEASDFRDVEGIPFPFRITTFVADQVAAETILDRVTPEADFEPGLFLPAGTAADL
jgi:hypothetical protein